MGEDLKPGMEVLVATDGIEPSADYQPRIRGLWQPQ